MFNTSHKDSRFICSFFVFCVEALRRLCWPRELPHQLCLTPLLWNPAQSKACPNPSKSTQKPRLNLHQKRGRNGRKSSQTQHTWLLQKLQVKMMVSNFTGERTWNLSTPISIRQFWCQNCCFKNPPDQYVTRCGCFSFTSVFENIFYGNNWHQGSLNWLNDHLTH